MIQTPSKITYKEYARLPDDQRAEVIEGELLMSPAPSPYHQEVLSKLFKLIEAFVTTHSLGKVFFAPCDVVLTRHDIVQPDLLFAARNRLSTGEGNTPVKSAVLSGLVVRPRDVF